MNTIDPENLWQIIDVLGKIANTLAKIERHLEPKSSIIAPSPLTHGSMPSDHEQLMEMLPPEAKGGREHDDNH